LPKKELQRVTRAAEKAARSRLERDEAIRQAIQAGETLRAVAEAAGLSHTQIRRLVQS